MPAGYTDAESDREHRDGEQRRRPIPNAANNTATTSTLVAPPRADLSITKGRPVRRSLGATLAYDIVVTNHGPSDAPDVTVADPTPVGLTFVSNAGACTTAFPCSLGAIPAGQSRVIHVAVPDAVEL